VSGSRALPPRWPPQCSCVVNESSFDPGERLQAPGSLLLVINGNRHLDFLENKKVQCNFLGDYHGGDCIVVA
jgi:hypothetical protein